MRGVWYERALSLGRRFGSSTVRPMRTPEFVPIVVAVALLVFFGPVFLEGLVGPRSPEPPLAPVTVTLASKAPPPRPSVIVHVVRPGENLWAIARKFAVDVATLTEANALPTPDRLQVGQKLTVPSPLAIEEDSSLPLLSERLRDGIVRRIRPGLAVVHTVEEGESFASVARAYGVGVRDLRAANPETDGVLRVGDQLRIPPGRGVFHVVEEGETLDGLAARYRVEPEAIAKANGLAEGGRLWAGEELFIPGGRPPAPPTAGGRFVWPVRGRVTDDFGRREHPLSGAEGFHRGIDIAAPFGHPFVAARDGRVIFSGWRRNYGRTIIVDHGGGGQTLYAHNSANLVVVGQWVRQGEVIGRVGETGRVTGPHLHFEILEGDRALNPLLALRR